MNHDVESFQCKVSDISFALKCRLLKHENAHSMQNVKFCHYHNNNKQCPVEEIGCMFRHEESKLFLYGIECKNRLCQFRHEKQVVGETVLQNQRTSDTEQSVNGNKSELENDDGSDSEEEDLECEDCGKVSEDFDSYIEHRGM